MSSLEPNAGARARSVEVTDDELRVGLLARVFICASLTSGI